MQKFYSFNVYFLRLIRRFSLLEYASRALIDTIHWKYFDTCQNHMVCQINLSSCHQRTHFEKVWNLTVFRNDISGCEMMNEWNIDGIITSIYQQWGFQNIILCFLFILFCNIYFPFHELIDPITFFQIYFRFMFPYALFSLWMHEPLILEERRRNFL